MGQLDGRVFLPDFQSDGIGGGYLPPRLSGTNDGIFFLYADQRDDVRLNRVRNILQRRGQSALREMKIGAKYCLFLPNTFELTRQFFRSIGIAKYRLVNNDSNLALKNSNVLSSLQKKVFGDLQISLDAINPRFIGINRFNQEVFSTILGRSVTGKDGKRNAEFERVGNGRLKGDISPDAFFRATNEHTFDNCARNIGYMFATKRFPRTSNLNVIYSDIIASIPENENGNNYSVLALQENIEAHLVDFFAAMTKKNNDGRSNALAFDESLIANNERNGVRSLLQQFSTPFPMAQVGFDLTVPTDGAKILEPTAGNGVLISPFLGRSVNLNLFELDKNRAARLNSLAQKYNNSDVVVGDCVKSLDTVSNDMDIVVANPPFEALKDDQQVVDKNGTKITLRSLDHLIAFKALEKLKDDGRAFLVLPADMIEKGRLKGAKRFWDNYLRATYHVAGSACVDGRLFRKMGAQFPTLMYSIAGRRSTPLSNAEIREQEIEELPLLRSFDQIYAWADATREKVFAILPKLREQEAANWLGASSKPNAPRVPNEPRVSAAIPASPVPEEEKTAKPVSEEKQPDNEANNKNDNDVRKKRRSSKKETPETLQSDAIDENAEEAEEPENLQSPYIDLVDDLADNPLLSAYSSFSKVGTSSTRIQKALESNTYQALADVEAKYGDIDEFVAKKLNLSVAELGERFSPEQVDGAALAFSRMDEGKGFLFSDLMGVGKGRELAMMAFSAFSEDRPVIFWTEQPNLFTDFVARDMSEAFGMSATDIKEKGILHPFIFNQGAEARVIDNDTLDVLYDTGNVPDAKKNGIPSNINFVLSTYSQVQTKQGVWKADAMLNWLAKKEEEGKKPLLILDECHKSAGESSRTGDVIKDLVRGVKKLGGNVVYSSATPLKSAKNIGIYTDILPETEFSTDALVEMIEASPVALQEVLATEMARIGSTISREIDTSGVKRRFVSTMDIDPLRHNTIIKNLDVVSEFLSELVEKAHDVDEIGRKLGSQYASTLTGEGQSSKKVDVTTTSPVSQFHNLSQYMMSAAKTAFAEDLIMDAIADGVKPVIVVENTGNDILRRFSEREGSVTEMDGKTVQIIDRLPNIGDILKENADKLLDVTIVDPLGEKYHTRLENDGSPLSSWLIDFKRRVDEADLSDLTISPIDKIIEIADKHGLSIGEITKRNLCAKKMDNGQYVVSKRSIPDKREVVRDFNNGLTDIIIMNRAAATGISMHCSPAVGCDLRPRRMIKIQLQSEITAETQINGRIQRFGQVHDAEYDIPLMGIAADDRLCQLFNMKNRNLSATSSGIRENKNNISEASDLLNPVGNKVVYDYLVEHENLAENLGIKIGEKDGEYARKLMGRLVCLPVASQEAVLSDIDTKFKMEIEVLNSRGLNPLKLSSFDWKATVEQVEEVVQGNNATQTIGKKPVFLNKVTFQENIVPISFDGVNKAVQRGEDNLTDDFIHRVISPSEVVGDLFDKDNKVNWDNPYWDKALGRRDIDISLGINSVSVEEANSIFKDYCNYGNVALSVDEKRIVKALDFAIFLRNQLPQMRVGNFVQVPVKLAPNLEKTGIMDNIRSEFSEDDLRKGIKVPAVITSINFNRDDLSNIAAWKVTLAVPGEKATTTYPFTTFYGIWESLSVIEKVDYSDFYDPIANTKVPLLFSRYGQFLSKSAKDDVVSSLSFSDIHKDKNEKLNLTNKDLDDLNINSNQRLREYVKNCFDLAPAGVVTRSRFTLEGNLFKACALSDPRQKIAYTTSDGELHNAILLPKDIKEADLIVQMKKKAENFTICLPDVSHPNEFLQSLLHLGLDIYGHGLELDQLTDFDKELFVGHTARIIVCQYTRNNAELIKKEDELVKQAMAYVSDNMSQVARDFFNCFNNKKRPAEIFAGSDVFQNLDMAYETYLPSGRSVLAVRGSYPLIMGAVNSNDVNDMRILCWYSSNQFIFNKKNSFFTDEKLQNENIKNFLEDSQNHLSDIGRLTKGNLAFRALWPEKTNMSVKIFLEMAKQNGKNIMLGGGFVDIFKCIEKYQPLIFADNTLENNKKNEENDEAVLAC